MKRLATIALAVLIVVGLSSAAMAERTALSIDGLIQILGAYEENTGRPTGNLANAGQSGNNNRVEQLVQLNVDADLTENLSAHVGLEAAGVWGDEAAADLGNQNRGAFSYGTVDDQSAALMIDEAYVVAKELIYQPLTVKAGVQSLEYSLRNDGNAMFLSVPEMGAWKGTLNYDPLYVDLTIGKVIETGSGWGWTDCDLYALAVEYYLEKKGKVQVIIAAVSDEQAETSLTEYAAGVTYMVLEDLEVFVQLGGQGGQVGDVDCGEMAINLGAEYTFSKVAHKPYIGLSYQMFGGDDTDMNWVPMGDVDETLVLEADRDLRDHGRGYGKLLATNYYVIRLVGGAEVNEKTKVDAGLGFFTAVEDFGGDDDIGTEIDVKLSHQFTDDLSVGTGLGYLATGDAWADDEAMVALYVTATLDF